MSHKIACYTLFDITHTGVPNRARPEVDADPVAWSHQRNTQCNLDTILQAISLRSQPEIILNPVRQEKKLKELDYFGFLYNDEEQKVPYWYFEFMVQHPSVFEDGISNLGHLYYDCEGIPMIKCGTEFNKINNFLDTSPELRNIFFIKYEYEQ